MAALVVWSVDPPDNVVRLETAQQDRVDRIRVCAVAEVGRPDRPEEPVAVPARRAGAGDPFEPHWRVAERHRDRGQTPPTIREGQGAGLSDAYLYGGCKPVQPVGPFAGRNCALKVGVRYRTLPPHPLHHSG